MTLLSLARTTKHAVRRAAIRGGLEAISLMRHTLPDASRRGVIFTLHHVRPPRDDAFRPNAPLEIAPSFLSQTIRTVKAAGYTLVHVEDLADLLAVKDDPRKFAAFTLDDGCRDNFDFAYPVFKAHQAPFTIFITAGLAERTSTMWWLTVEEMLRHRDSVSFDFGHGIETLTTMTAFEKQAAFDRFANFLLTGDEDKGVAAINDTARASGVDPAAIVARETMDVATLRELARDPLVRYGAHTLTHVNLARVSPERLMRELSGSADKLVEFTGVRPKAFAYPYGSKQVVGAREAEAARAAGFKIAVTTQPGLLCAGSLKRATELPRVSLNGHFQKTRYVSALMSGLPFVLRQ
jgi:peptidoglycan/xylan/chitin deacetylase (PgdA/CDA1 family)